MAKSRKKTEYFNLQFNKSYHGEAEFEEKLRQLAKENGISMAKVVMELVMSVDNFSVRYDVKFRKTENDFNKPREVGKKKANNFLELMENEE